MERGVGMGTYNPKRFRASSAPIVLPVNNISEANYKKKKNRWVAALSIYLSRYRNHDERKYIFTWCPAICESRGIPILNKKKNSNQTKKK